MKTVNKLEENLPKFLIVTGVGTIYLLSSGIYTTYRLSRGLVVGVKKLANKKQTKPAV